MPSRCPSARRGVVGDLKQSIVSYIELVLSVFCTGGSGRVWVAHRGSTRHRASTATDTARSACDRVVLTCAARIVARLRIGSDVPASSSSGRRSSVTRTCVKFIAGIVGFTCGVNVVHEVIT